MTIQRCGTSEFTPRPIPGRPTNVHMRVDGWPNQQFALLFVDWLRADPDVRADYLAVKRAAEAPRSRGSSIIPAGVGMGRHDGLAALTNQRRSRISSGISRGVLR